MRGYCQPKTAQRLVVMSVMKRHNIVTVEVPPVSTSQVSRKQELDYAVLPGAGRIANALLSISEAISQSLQMLAFVMKDGLGSYANSIPVLERAAWAMAYALQQVIEMLNVYICDSGFSGESCQNSCDGYCQGSFPYGCAREVAGKVKLGCDINGGCSYLNNGEQYPYNGFCTYNEALTQSNCLCGSENDCEVVLSCSSNGSCPAPQYLPDATPCNVDDWIVTYIPGNTTKGSST